MSEATIEAVESLARLIHDAVPSDVPGFRFRYAVRAARNIFGAGYIKLEPFTKAQEAIAAAEARGYQAAIDEVERQARGRGFAPEDMDQGTQWFRILDSMAGREPRA
ncbi:MAG: hypothetical protein ACRDS9_10660 [Pseudonocardiaceae bacterium]